MEFLLFPILLAMLFLAVPAVNLVAGAYQRSRRKSSTLAWFFGATVTVFVIAFVAPHAWFHPQVSHSWNLLLGLTATHLALAFIGCILGFGSRPAEDSLFRILAAALIVSAALFPIGWFTLTAPLLKLLSVESGQ